MRRALSIATLMVAAARAAAQSAPAQAPSADSLRVTASVPTDRFIDRYTPLEFTLNRPLLPDEGDIAVMIGSLDVSDLLERGTTRVLYRPHLGALPAGEREVVVYRRSGGRWTELQRFALKVLRRGGLVRVSLAPTMTLGNNGQIAEGRSRGIPEPARRTFQDFTLSSGFQSTHEGVGWALETQGNVVGASRQEQALRFGERGAGAPLVDLSEYRVTLRARRSRLALGHVSVGANRHLANAFGSRGVTLATDAGPATLTLGALNGSAVVGWNNPLGLDRASHRVLSASLGSELLPRPGAFRVDVTMLDGSLLPQTSLTQGAVVDAEESRGAGVTLSAATADQRLRLSGGYARNRFTNPAHDHELLGDTAVRRVRPETRSARYVELAVGLLQGSRVPLLGATTLGTTYRHERVDPLFRSVAAPVQADRVEQAVDVQGSAGVVAAQLSFLRSHDNLDDVPSVLRTLSRQGMAQLTLALPTLAAFLPTVSYAGGRTHQLAAGTPTNGDFRPTDLPDQISTSHNADAQWQMGRWRLAYRFTSSDQDNRQPTRELADFVTRTHGVTVGFSLGTAEVSSDASAERHRAREHDETSLVRRLGVGLAWRPLKATSLSAILNALLSEDASRPRGSRNTEARLELSQGLLASRGQLFLRYASTSATLPAVDFTGLDARQRQWTLASGFSLRLF